QRHDAHGRVGTDADANAALAELLDRREAVAEVGLGRRADADPGAGVGDQVELVVVGMRRVDECRARTQAATVCEQFDRSQALFGYALLDLAGLLVGVHVERQFLADGVVPELLEPGGRAAPRGRGVHSRTGLATDRTARRLWLPGS